MPTASRRSPVQGMRRGVLVAGVTETAAITAVGAAVGGTNGALSALAGALLAFVVILVGLLAISLVVSGEPGMSTAGAGVVYLGQLILLAAALLILRDAPWLEGRYTATAAIIATVALQTGLIVGYARSRHLVYAGQARA